MRQALLVSAAECASPRGCAALRALLDHVYTCLLDAQRSRRHSRSVPTGAVCEQCSGGSDSVAYAQAARI